MAIRRFVGKASDDNPTEGLTRLLAKMTGLDPSEIQLSDELLANIKQMQTEKIEIRKIINPHYDNLKFQNTKESNKKVHELIDLGRFIYGLNLENEIKIVECSERPDFIISRGDESIGIEHTGIYDENVVAEIKTLRKIIGKCQKRLNNVRSDIKGLFNVVVLPSELKGKLVSKEEEIIQSICNYVIAIYENAAPLKPDFIADIVHAEHSILELTLGEDYWLSELTSEVIANTILKKENRIEAYKSSRNLNKCWLLIVIDGASSASSFNIKLDNLPVHLTLFDEIYIFDRFKSSIIKSERN